MNIYQVLKKHKYHLTKQQYKTLKGQVKAGDELGAIKGLTKLLSINSELNVSNRN